MKKLNSKVMNSPTYLYIIESFSGDRFKVGITKNLSSRVMRDLVRYTPFLFRPLIVLKFNNRTEAARVEDEIHHHLSDWKYYSGFIDKSRECYFNGINEWIESNDVTRAYIRVTCKELADKIYFKSSSSDRFLKSVTNRDKQYQQWLTEEA